MRHQELRGGGARGLGVTDPSRHCPCSTEAPHQPTAEAVTPTKPLLALAVYLGLCLCTPATIAEDSSTGWDRPPAKEALDIRSTAGLHDFIDRWTGSRLYPSQYGAPGWPGYKEGDETRGKKWGFPERIPYPGSIEHVRNNLQRYVPPVPIFNARSLLKNFLAAEISGVASERVTDYAEPVYYVPKYSGEAPTGDTRQPVKVVRWDKTHPPFELDFGRLGPGVYAVRIIAATPAEHVQRSPQRVVVGFSVNDGLKGEVTEYKKRCAATDEFYSIVEFFFHAPEARSYRCKLWLDESTRLPVILVRNIDLHDKLAQLARASGKKTPAYYDAREREEGWKKAGTHKPDSRSPEQRFSDDLATWNAGMSVNAQPASYGYLENWQALHRSAQCLIPEGVKDDGMGIDFYGKDLLWNRGDEFLEPRLKDWTVKRATQIGPRLKLERQTAYPVAWSLECGAAGTAYGATKLASQYHETGNEELARKAAILLARLGLQNITHGCRQTMSPYDLIPQLVHGDTAFRRREKQMPYSSRGAYGESGKSFITAYDYLFPYVKGNQDLADSLNRFLPGIRDPQDVLRFYETCVLQYYAFQVMSYNAFLDSPTPAWMANVIAVQQDPRITKPWVDWLFRYVWTYPNIPSGVDETIVNAVGRDGGNRKGSVSYSKGGSFLPALVASLKAYQKSGGKLPPYVANAEELSKAVASRSFPNDVMVAGGYAFWIGDVSGPNRPRSTDDPRNQSRVLSNWFGVLETGLEHDDFRFRRAAGLRVGFGVGHHHDDPLDLQIWAHGVPMCGDGGGRTGYAVPANRAVQSHNTVVSSQATASLHRWVSSFVPISGAQYLQAQVKCDGVYGRQIALIDVDEGRPAEASVDWPATPNSYVVDVFRVSGGNEPYYAFHGPPADQLETNARRPRKGEFGGFLDEESKWEGRAPKTFTATWRMRREPEIVKWRDQEGDEQVLNVPGAERMAMNEKLLGARISAGVPRKFIRMHMPGHKKSRVRGARALCLRGETFTNENVYVSPRKWKGEIVFPVVFEPFAGESFIESARLLIPSRSLAAASTTVAIEIALGNGRRDLILMAGSAGKAGVVPASPLPKIEGITAFDGEYAYLSWDDEGLRRAVLVGGTRLETEAISITADRPAYEGEVVSIDYHARKAELSQPLPRGAAGAVMEIGPVGRRTSYTIDSVKGTQVNFRKGMDLAMSRVREFLEDGAPVLQSQVERLEGLVATDAEFKHRWQVGPPVTPRGEATGLSAAAGGGSHPSELQPWELAINLTNGPKPKDVLTVGDALWLWEFGPGDPYRLSTQVNVLRAAGGKYSVAGNVKAEVRTDGDRLTLEPQ